MHARSSKRLCLKATRSVALAADPACQLHVTGHDRHALCVAAIKHTLRQHMRSSHLTIREGRQFRLEALAGFLQWCFDAKFVGDWIESWAVNSVQVVQGQLCERVRGVCLWGSIKEGGAYIAQMLVSSKSEVR